MKITMILITFILLLVFFGIFLSSIYAQENISRNETNKTNITIENISLVEIKDIEIIKFFPKEVKAGGVQFSIRVKNNKNQTLENVFAIIKGKGFSTYDVIPIEELVYNERDYIFVNGNLAESGEINLTIIIGKNIFYQQITVFDVSKKEQENEKEENLQRLNEVSQELEELKKNYIDLELEISEKKDNNYDVSSIDLEDLKKYIRNIESGVITKNFNEAEVNLKLAKEEYNYQKNKVDNAKLISILTRIRENALIITTFISTILAFFALSELLKKKGESTIHAIGRVKKVISKRMKKR